MIARALYVNANLLCFDEATSQLDGQSEQRITEAINSLQFTRLVIAHRLQTIERCIRRLRIDGGQITEFEHSLGTAAGR